MERTAPPRLAASHARAWLAISFPDWGPIRLRGFLDGMSLAINLLRDKPDLSDKDVGQIIGVPKRLFLPDRNDGNTQSSDVTDASGKHLRR